MSPRDSKERRQAEQEDMGACQPSAVTASAPLRGQARSGLEQSRSPHGARQIHAFFDWLEGK